MSARHSISQKWEVTANWHCYTSCTLTTVHCSKVSFHCVVPWKDIIQSLQKCEGCTLYLQLKVKNYSLWSVSVGLFLTVGSVTDDADWFLLSCVTDPDLNTWNENWLISSPIHLSSVSVSSRRVIRPGIRGYSPGSLCLRLKKKKKIRYNGLMMKTAPEIFTWLHMERPAATNATLSPEADPLPLWQTPIYGQSQNHELLIQHQCSFPFYVSLMLPEPPVSLLLSATVDIRRFIAVSYCRYTEVYSSQLL